MNLKVGAVLHCHFLRHFSYGQSGITFDYVALIEHLDWLTTPNLKQQHQSDSQLQLALNMLKTRVSNGGGENLAQQPSRLTRRYQFDKTVISSIAVNDALQFLHDQDVETAKAAKVRSKKTISSRPRAIAMITRWFVSM